MRYFVFEAGSRAGFSAERFFLDYKKRCPNNDILIMADADPTFYELDSVDQSVIRVSERDALKLISDEDTIFPADELTRQRYVSIANRCSNKYYSQVDKCYYNKSILNTTMFSTAKWLKIPKTFCFNDVFVKPNTMSAGSKGCERLENICVSENIDIDREFVVDVFESDGHHTFFPREVKLKNGYDKYIKFLDNSHPLVERVHEFVSMNKIKLFTGIFHVQVAKSKSGEYFYIESSKRISGSSIVELHKGYNPFCLMNNINTDTQSYVEDNVWYRFEDLI